MNHIYALSAFLRRIRATSAIDDEDREALSALPFALKRYDPKSRIAVTGDRANSCFIIVEGFVVRAAQTKSGGRQILSLHLPGDLPDLQTLYLKVMDHDITTLNECIVAFISHDALRAVMRERPRLSEAILRGMLTDAAIFREWILNVGQREAVARIAHVLIEVCTRLKLVGRVNNGEFDFPVSQTELADAIGISPVHANRVIQHLRAEGLVEMGRGKVRILQEERLCQLSGFDPLYLHLTPDT